MIQNLPPIGNLGSPPAFFQTILYTPASFMPILLPTCIFLLAVDVAVRISHRNSPTCSSAVPYTASTVGQCDPLKTLATRANQVFLDFQELERRLAVEKARPKHLSLIIPRPKMMKNMNIVDAHNALVTPAWAGRLSRSYNRVASEAVRSQRMNSAFITFCERLLLMNRIWKQERELNVLRARARSTDKAKCSNAFEAFCDRLLLSNRIWKLEKEVNALTREKEKMRRSRVAAVTRAAKRMVLDVRKERLIEEFVKDLIVDVEEGKQAIATLREDHEHEIREIMGDWRRDYGELRREVEGLRLAQEARWLEQEVSNELEQSLYEKLCSIRQKVDTFHDGSTSTSISPIRGERLVGTDEETLSGDFDDIANMSSSTCVSVRDHNEIRKGSAMASGSRRRCSTSNPHTFLSTLRIPLRTAGTKRQTPHVSPSASSPLRKLDTGPYVGFSFNPLFFGHPEPSSSKTSKYASEVETSGYISTTGRKARATDSTQLSRRARIDPWKF